MLREIWNFLTFQDMPAARVDRQVQEQRSAIARSPIPSTVGKAQWPKRDVGTYIRQGYDQIVVVYRCINVVANATATATLRAYENDAGGQRDETKKHPGLRDLLSNPNPQMSQFEFVNAVVKIAQATGFCVLEKERSNAGNVIALWPLRSDWLKPIPRDQAPDDWQYNIPGVGPKLLRSEDVIPFVAESDPLLSPTGSAPLASALREVGIENDLTNFTKRFFERGAVPMYGLIPDPDAVVDQAGADSIKERFRQASGLSAAADPIILDAIKDVKRLGLDFDEMAYPELRALTALQICTAFGVPPIMIGVKPGLDSSTYSNYGQARKAFYEDTIQPLWARLDGALSRGLLGDFGAAPNISLEFDTGNVPAFQEDTTAKYDRYRQWVSAGLMTPNQALKKVGEQELPTVVGDVLYLPLFNMPVNLSGIATQDPAVASTDAARMMTPDGQIVTGLPLPRLQRGRTDNRRLTGQLVTREVRDLIERRANRLYTATAFNYSQKIQTYLQDQKARVLEAMSERSMARPAYQVRDIADVIAIDWTKEADDLDPLIRQLWNLLGEQAAGDITDLLKLDAEGAIDWDISNQWVQNVLADVGPRVTNITEMTRQDIAKIVNDSLDEGVTVDELANRLEGLYDETYAGRSMTIARTESMNAYNFASAASFEESGLVTEVELLDNSEHTTDPGSDGLTCAERDGLVVQLANVRKHIAAEHPNGSLAIAPVVKLGEE